MCEIETATNELTIIALNDSMKDFNQFTKIFELSYADLS